jgi:signal transduction histidine kinase
MAAFPLTALFLFNGIFVLGAGLVLAWLFRRRQDISARLWIAAGFFTALATILTAFKPDLPEFLGFWLPNLMQVLHQFLMGFSFLALCGVKVQQRWAAASLGLVVLFGAGLYWLIANYPATWVVPYVSLVNGMVALGISDLINRQRKSNPALRYLICPQTVLLVMGILWLLRLPMSAAGLTQHALDPGLGNWLIFVSLLTMNIVLQFSYFAVRLAASIENRVQLVEINLRLRTLVSEHEVLLPKIEDGLASLPNLAAQTLSAQIAHEVNQPLAALRLTLETMMIFPADRPDNSKMSSMVADIERIGTTVRGLQHLMSQQTLNMTQQDLGIIFVTTLDSLPGVELVVPNCPLPVALDASLFSKTLKTLVHWLQAYGDSSEGGVSKNIPIMATCGSAQEGTWAQIWLSAPSVRLDPDAITLLNSEKVLDPIGHEMPRQGVHHLIDILMVQHMLRAQKGRISAETRLGDSGTLLMLRIPIVPLMLDLVPTLAPRH